MTHAPSTAPTGLTRRLGVCLAIIACLLLLGLLALPTGPGTGQSATANQDDWAGHPRAIDRTTLDAANVPPAELRGAVNDLFLLRESDLVSLDLPPAGAFPEQFVVQMPLRGEWITLDLSVFSNRAENYRVLEQLDDGSLVEVDPGPVNTYRGFVPEIPGTIVSAGLIEGTLHGMLQLPDGTRYMVEAVADRVPDAHPSVHVLYDMRDADCASSTCGVPGHWQHEAQQAAQEPLMDGDEGGATGGLAGDDCEQVLIAIDADFPYFQIHGSNTTNRIHAIMNNTNTIYENELGLRHWITDIIIRTSAAANPYSGPLNGGQCPSGGGSASNLLSQFRNVWVTSPESQIQRNIAHLFTGCTNIDAGGIAYLNAVCKSITSAFNPPYSLAAHTSSLSCATHVTTHELGHNWGAPHCSNCSGTIMHPTFPPCTTVFANSSKNTITSYKNSSSGWCTTPCGPPQPQPPANDTCQGSIVVSEGVTPFNNELATTTGPDEPDLCDFAGETQIQTDVWYRHTAGCTGDLTVSLCETAMSLDTKMAVYGIACPTGPGDALGCNKDSCGNLSSVTIPVTSGQIIRIRIGTHNGAEGQGILEITCNVPQEPSCPGDINNNGTVDGFDLVYLLSCWGDPGQHAVCEPADINEDGVVNGFDLVELLSAWGPCP